MPRSLLGRNGFHIFLPTTSQLDCCLEGAQITHVLLDEPEETREAYSLQSFRLASTLDKPSTKTLYIRTELAGGQNLEDQAPSVTAPHVTLGTLA